MLQSVNIIRLRKFFFTLLDHESVKIDRHQARASGGVGILKLNRTSSQVVVFCAQTLKNVAIH